MTTKQSDIKEDQEKTFQERLSEMHSYDILEMIPEAAIKMEYGNRNCDAALCKEAHNELRLMIQEMRGRCER